MSFDKNDLDKILGLPRDEFDRKLKRALDASGVDKKVAEALLKDTGKIRGALSGLQESDLAKLSEIVQKKNLGNIESIIKNEINERR